MKVILVNGSPHPQGKTYAALKEAAITLEEEGIETEIFWIGSKPIPGCTACSFCLKTSRCKIDDIVNIFLDKIEGVDGFIFASPVYFGSANGSLISFMDRVFYAERANKFYLKPAAAVVTARRSGTTATWDQLNKYFGLKQMPIISSQYWNNVYGDGDEEGLQTMRTLAKNMAFFLKCQKVGLENGVPLPEKEPIKRTNFIRN